MDLSTAFLPHTRLTTHVPGRIQHAPDQVIPHPGQVFHATAADHRLRVLLKIMPDPGDICGYFHALLQPDARHLPKRRVGLLRRRRIHPRTRARRLRTPLQRRRLGLRHPGFSTIPNQLVNRWQNLSSLVFCDFPVQPVTHASRQAQNIARLASWETTPTSSAHPKGTGTSCEQGDGVYHMPDLKSNSLSRFFSGQWLMRKFRIRC